MSENADTRRMQAEDDYEAAKRFYHEALNRADEQAEVIGWRAVLAIVLAEWKARAEE